MLGIKTCPKNNIPAWFLSFDYFDKTDNFFHICFFYFMFKLKILLLCYALRSLQIQELFALIFHMVLIQELFSLKMIN